MGRSSAADELGEPDRRRQRAHPATALDIGCGTGDNSIYLAGHGWQVTGVDYVREVTAVAAPGARLLLVEFIPGRSYGVPGIEPSEVAQRFEGPWTLLSSGSEPAMNHNGKDAGRYYLLSRAS